VVSLSLAVLFLFSQPAAQAQAVEQTRMPPPSADDLGHHWLAEGKLAAELSVGDVRERVTGRASLYLVASPKNMERGYVTVRGFNILFTGVNQKLLAPGARIAQPLGLLGFSVASGKPQQLKYDPRTGRVAGELRLYADASFLAAFARREGDGADADGKDDQFLTPTIPVTAAIDLALEKPVSIRGLERQQMPGRLELKLESGEFTYERLKCPPFRLRLLEAVPLKWELYPVIWFEVAQRLCIQPVRLLRITWTGWWFPTFQIQLTGAGLPFGEPGLRAQWAKADVVFTIRDWKTIWAGNFWELDSGEADALRATVEDDDCIEVFFPYDFDPDSMWGGGATFGSGTATAQVISSDGNARGGVDFTHLAHEFGHVLGLRHPGAVATASAVPASTGTLMCPSGYLNDNPQINSQENKDLLSNPLLTFAIKPIGPGPDCQNSADCGACP
jgi:hypothetical protein